MHRPVTADDKYRQMLETPIPRLICSLSVPTVVSMLITSLYNMADTYFVGLIGSASATGAVGVAYPLMAVLQAVGFMFGHGSGNYISRALGAKQTDDASRMAATGFFSALLCGALLTAAGLCFLRPLVFLLGSTETIAPYAVDYVRFILLGAPWMVSSLVLNNQLRFQGNAFYGMIGITSGAVINIALDPLFIFALDMGVAGAALATILSQFISFLLLLAGTRRGDTIRIRPRLFSPNRDMFGNIFRGGVPSLLRQGLASLSTVCLNVAAGGFGDAAIAAMSIVTRIMQFACSAVIGFGQGFQPICGFNYGAKRYDRVREAFWFCVRVAFVILAVAGAVAFVFAPQIVSWFIRDNPEVISIGALTLRLQCVMLPFASFIITANMMLQTMGMAGKASLLAAARQGLFFIPAVLALPYFFGLLGVQLAQPVSDVLSFALSIPLTLEVLRMLRRGPHTQEDKA
ncbi:MAG: MATE family efflux transporter [Eubacteriales bacterium]|nr:MATE family efflux transporter [Eubacteriales bacterium]